MRILILAALLGLFATVSSAQVIEGFGVQGSLGSSVLSTGFEEFEPRSSYAVGAYGEFGISRDLRLVAEVEFSRRGYKHWPLGPLEDAGLTDIDMISVPIWARIGTAVTRNVDLYAGFGPRLDYLLAVRPAPEDALGEDIDTNINASLLITAGVALRGVLPVKTRLGVRFSQGLTDLTATASPYSVTIRYFDVSLAVGL